MKTQRVVILLFWLLLYSTGNVIAQKRNTLFISDDKLELLIDYKSSKQQLDSILKVAGIPGADATQIQRQNYTSLKNDGWRQSGRYNGMAYFTKPLADLDKNPQAKPFIISVNMFNSSMTPGYPDRAFGVNSFVKVSVFDLPSGYTRFVLPGYLTAKRVLLSGSFNTWSTSKGTMTKTDTGWVKDVKLEAGVYAYKFVINGRWLRDGNNRLTEDDGWGSLNSIYFKCNYTFKLAGYSTLRRVTVAGNFNNWNANELVMMRTGNTWQRRVYLREGTYDYRFMMDGKWATDPANPVIRKDAEGNSNSVLMLGESATFRLNGYPDARKVCVAGDFNGWKPDALFMKRTATGWALPYVLPTGNYQYKFIVDGNWITDPANPHQATGDGEANSFMSLNPNCTFRLKGYNNAHSVRLSGEFNGWDPSGYSMAHRNGEWVISIRLKPGKHLYKFVVDGEWIIDPGNKQWEQNEHNTGNSVLWVER